jgi:photoactive yellow protein
MSMSISSEAVTSGSAEPVSSTSGDLHDRSDVELDLLPYGVICLDRDGTIVRYNRVEARFARLDRALVMGKTFFGKVAPCAATHEFEGRFRAFVADPAAGSRIKFPYVFNFRFGSQEVDVEIRRSRSPQHFYVCVGRRKFQSHLARDVPGAERPAIAIAELAPEEFRQGVVRDDVQRRNVVVDALFFEALQNVVRDPERAQEIGLAWGRRVAIDLETEASESFNGSLRELPIVTVLELVGRYIRRHGWGHFVTDLEQARSGIITFHLERSVLAESSSHTNEPRCGVITGFIRAILTHLAGRPLFVRETECRALGASACKFVATGKPPSSATGDAAR